MSTPTLDSLLKRRLKNGPGSKATALTMILVLAVGALLPLAPLAAPMAAPKAAPTEPSGSSATQVQQPSRGWAMVAATGPAARFQHAMAYDSARGRVVLFGGINASGGQQGDTWEWDGSAWADKTPGPSSVGPSPRYGHAMAYDSIRGKVLLFGGIAAGGFNGETWEWNGTLWQQIAVAGPSPRFGHAMASENSASSSILLFGGLNNTGVKSDTWEWTGSNWLLRNTPGPSARYSHAMANDSQRRRVVLFGGGLYGNNQSKHDTWEWDGSHWTQVSNSGPPGRYQHAMEYDSRCKVTLLFGGRNLDGLLGDTWAWNSTTWMQSPDSGPSGRAEHAMAYDEVRGKIVLFGGYDNHLLGDTWEWGCPCDDDAAPLDDGGNVRFPPELDQTEPITYEDVDQNDGSVSDLYSSFDTTTDTWYTQFPCDPSIGGTVPPAASNPDLAGELASLGITGVTPQQMADTLNTYQDMISNKAQQETDSLPTAPPVTNPYTYSPPAAPHCVTRGCKYVFGGRDLIFVHGLQMEPLFDKIFGTNPKALTTWPNDKAEFYGNGYWKKMANGYWSDHIKRFLKSKGVMNRYLIVAYPSTQRLEIAAQAILAQIADAMISGTGVVDPSGHNDKTKFGTPSFVAISHSTGGLAFDVAMTAAAQYPNLKAQFIPQFAKAHIALNAVFSGSHLATAVVALAEYIIISGGPPPWLCPLANLFILALNETGSTNPTLTCPPNYAAIATSVLVDLVPSVTQLKWGNYVRNTPVRTLTVIGGHPSYLAPLKHILMMGFDDGVSTINSQVANPNSVLLWPSGFEPKTPFGLVKIFDMGVWRTYPLRAIGYYIDQAGDHVLNPFSFGPHPKLVAGGATPYVSPSGMVQPVGVEYPLTSGFSPLRRYPNHFSYIQSAADHLGGSVGLNHNQYPSGFNGDFYRNTFGEHNFEETRVITDNSVYMPFGMFYPNDNQSLLTANKIPPVEEIVRGRKVTFKIKIFGKKFSKTWWIWKRRYHLLSGWENKTQMDYVYNVVLSEIPYPCPPPNPAHDCNRNGLDDTCEISSGSVRDCNGNGVPDNCEDFLPLKIIGQPISLTLSSGQTATFSVNATGPGTLSYQWRRNGVNLIDGGRISGAKTSTLTISPVLAADTGQYSVVVRSSCTDAVAISKTVALKLLPCVNHPGDMIAWYPFDEAGGTTAANLATGNTGLRKNGPTSITGKVARALSFDGRDDYVESPSSIVTNIGPALWPLPANCYSGSYSTCTGDFSIDTWIKLGPEPPTLMTILDKRSGTPPAINGYHLYVRQANRLGIQLADGVGSAGFTNYLTPPLSPLLTDGLWHHVAVTVTRRSLFFSGTIRWYHNGSLIGTNQTSRYGSLVNNSPLRIGAQSGSPPLSELLEGSLDELEIFNRALSPAEVSSLFNAGPGGKCK